MFPWPPWKLSELRPRSGRPVTKVRRPGLRAVTGRRSFVAGQQGEGGSMKLSHALAAAIPVISVFAHLLAPSAAADDSEQLLTVDHYVRVRSTVPAIAGQPAQIYVRERAMAGTVLRGATLPTASSCSSTARARRPRWRSTCPTRTTAGWRISPAPASTCSRWTRPATGARRGRRDERSVQSLARSSRRRSFPALIAAPCAPSYPHQLTTIASDWDDIDAVVDYVRALRRVDA